MFLAPSNISESTYRRQDIYTHKSQGRGVIFLLKQSCSIGMR